ncbi:molecular chaperone TorD family protein [Halorubrum lipolyticum]|uniref:DMSO reductase family type II enzyme chaperone n=1 Tax=Halorubrum lipolyticum DSM 21995 TaxID=1227482 RepID=M0P1D6_9EURY|nr:molecular chaperone TorD family protein [Halorubrum lipolyticum]EMA63891.1 DMSO reductase family type II enzyme chaperone [Halorubrum lipolyticum DSM 21995]
MTVSESTPERDETQSGGDGARPGDDPRPDAGLPSDAIDEATAARGNVYALAAAAFAEPSRGVYDEFADGSLDEAVATHVGESGLDVDPPDLTVDDDRETLAARYNDLFVVGYSEVIDGTDGTVENQGPPASLYESTYRSEVSWNDVNLDLARAYEHFGCEIGGEERRHHDHVRLELEFAGYLCRLAAADSAPDSGVDPGDPANLDRARLDFHDRHFSVLASGLRAALDEEPGTSVYGRLARFLDAFVAADVDDLADRLDAGVGGASS